MTAFLATTFADLANDPSWPWTSVKYKDPQRRVLIARLALMVVEEMTKIPWHNLSIVLGQNDINPDHYANVKKRVEEAKG